MTKHPIEYRISTQSSGGVFGVATGRTPLSALNALTDRRGPRRSAWAAAVYADGRRVSGFIYREGRQAVFSANAEYDYDGD